MPKNAKAAEVQTEEVETEGAAASDGGEFESAAAGAIFENTEDGLVVNLANVEEQKFETIPKGKYPVVVQDNTYSLSKSSGKPMWSPMLHITEGEYKGRKLFPILSFSEGALPGTKAVLAVVAPELLAAPFRVNDPEIVASIIGKFAKVNVGIQPKSEEYDERNTVKRWFQPDASAAFIGG